MKAFSPCEAAHYLGISRGLCYRLIHDGTIPAVRFGRRLVIPVAALEAILLTHNTEEADHAEK